jgi:hypothetical protein
VAQILQLRKEKTMGWAEDHRNTVADRWGQKYRESGMTVAEFSKYMKKTMLEYGWSEADADKMIARAIGKDDAQ